MAKREKGKVYYEVTKEKPFGMFQVLLMGGATGSVLAFLMVSLLGAFNGMEMDSLIFSFLIASFLGFFFGVLITWLFAQNFGNLILLSSFVSTPAFDSKNSILTNEVQTEESVVEDEEAKGKSIDFVFPELSPDK